VSPRIVWAALYVPTGRSNDHDHEDRNVTRTHHWIVHRSRLHGRPVAGRTGAQGHFACAQSDPGRRHVHGTATGQRVIAEQANRLGIFDAVIHNAGVGYRERRRTTEEGLPSVFMVNTLAPYILTALIDRPKRLVYLSSGMHRSARAHLDDLFWQKRAWDGATAYAESKLHDVLLAFAIARHWPSVLSNALEPGWVPTRMGGPGAPDDLDQGRRTQAWLAVSNDAAAMVTGSYFYHLRPRTPNPEAHDVALQEQLIGECQRLSGVALT
jgi:NAD(P)-dependent dehydrogenase (short-subunit alcohol dehydrogenase family)